MDDSILTYEQEKVVVYLQRYGNTRESDLISYGMQKLHSTENEMKQLINKKYLQTSENPEKRTKN
jgi:DNA-binding MarR family transcriptional regulator